jgi:hypothetical protein
MENYEKRKYLLPMVLMKMRKRKREDNKAEEQIWT